LCCHDYSLIRIVLLLAYKNQIIEALTTKHIETIKSVKLSSINAGEGCYVMLEF